MYICIYVYMYTYIYIYIYIYDYKRTAIPSERSCFPLGDETRSSSRSWMYTPSSTSARNRFTSDMYLQFGRGSGHDSCFPVQYGHDSLIFLVLHGHELS